VRRESPDVLLLVEYTPQWSKTADELRAAYPYRLEGPGTGAFGIALFSRLPFDSVRPFALGPTTAIDARIRTPAGALELIGVHLQSPTTPRHAGQRNRQLGFLAERLAKVAGPVAVIGDFNVTPYSPYYTEWLTQTGLTDTRRARTPSPSWPVWLPIFGIPIDHCAVSRDVGIVAHRALPSFGSDHTPILVELALPEPPHRTTNATDTP
jgi:endonuclease/exonuclease/phosphatase (EEP) superfamily protein YafD